MGRFSTPSKELLSELQRKATHPVTTVRENAFLREFREFALRGNMLDLAVGIMIGGGFNKIVSSLVEDVIMPPLGLLLGKVDFSNLYLNLSGQEYASLAAAEQAGAATLRYGRFFNSIIDFLVVALVVFIIIKQINRWRRKHEGPVDPEKVDCPFCRMKIPAGALRCAFCASDLTGSPSEAPKSL